MKVNTELLIESTLPRPIITIQSSPKAYGHFTTKEVWTDAQRKRSYYEINIGAERLNRPISSTVATLSAGCCPALIRWGRSRGPSGP